MSENIAESSSILTSRSTVPPSKWASVRCRFGCRGGSINEEYINDIIELQKQMKISRSQKRQNHKKAE